MQQEVSVPAAAPRWKIGVAMGLVYAIWSSTYLAIHFAVQTLPPLTMSGVRFLIGGTFLFVWSRLRGAPRPRPEHWRSALVTGALLLLFGNGLVVVAEQWVDSGLAALLVSTTPFFMVIFPWLFGRGERPTLPVALGIALGLVGVAILVRPSGGPGVNAGGALLLTGASITWAWGSLYSRRAPQPASPLLATGLQMLAGSALLLAGGALLGEFRRVDLGRASAQSLLAFAYLVVAAVVAFTAYLWLLRVASPALVSTYSYVNPLIAVVLGWALAGEPLTARTAVAAVVIVSGVALITVSRLPPRPRREPVPPSVPEPRAPRVR